ncbi:MAG: SGNH/GDSL hydrolase family protein [Planctomycetes bacterium]|nr:SGNH/GDSL hydrolase family protein [Planctomycetota bacterium]
MKWLALRLALVAASVVVGLLLAEAGLRLAGVGYPLPYAPDPYCGTRHEPRFRGHWTAEGRAAIAINGAGFRDRPRTKTPPPGTLRVAVLGDSYIEAFQVPLQQTFCAQLERELEGLDFTPHDIEVLSFGVSGFGAGQELLLLRHYVWDYQPDVVILAFYPGNDLADSSAELASYKVKPFFRLQDGELTLDDSFRRHPDYRKAQSPWTQFKVRLINRSRVLQLAAQARNIMRSPRTADEASPAKGPSIDEMCFVEPRQPSWIEAWEISERLLAKMHEECDDHDAEFLLATLSVPEQVDPDPAVRRSLERRLGVDDLFYCERRLEALGERLGFPVLNLAEPMQGYAEEHGVYLHGFSNTPPGQGHWNAAGHRLAARLAAPEVARLLSDVDQINPKRQRGQ